MRYGERGLTLSHGWNAGGSRQARPKNGLQDDDAAPPLEAPSSAAASAQAEGGLGGPHRGATWAEQYKQGCRLHVVCLLLSLRVELLALIEDMPRLVRSPSRASAPVAL